MEKVLLVLLGVSLWQLVVFITILVTDEDEEKVFGLGIGIVGWFIYGIMFIIAKITKYYTKENQAKRIVKSAKRQLKKDNQDWAKWYKKFGKYSSNAWNIARKNNQELFEQMRIAGFNNSIAKRIIY